MKVKVHVQKHGFKIKVIEVTLKVHVEKNALESSFL